MYVPETPKIKSCACVHFVCVFVCMQSYHVTEQSSLLHRRGTTGSVQRYARIWYQGATSLAGKWCRSWVSVRSL